MIDSLKDLERLLKVLRKQGVYEFEHNGTRLKLGEMPQEANAASYGTPAGGYEGFPQGDLTPEQLLFYSSGGLPENDPALKQESA